ncbi:fidgetin-like protein 1 isoform X1 [Anastrepha ludens]|uniref:fidgetin-like protein 1 isoform X1 n=1 Tax=Anastrepha ludens TaxID=28586 RepID=UPI0023B1F9F7|nr:fidgetin-like protein 1 isoform X1 [Anastrepha ludens]
MCENKVKTLEQFVINENTWKSTTANTNERAAAWRRQLFLLENPIHELPNTETYELLERHYTRLDSNCLLEHRKQRIESVNLLLKKYDNLQLSKVQKCDNYLFEDCDFEPPCRGIYESCKSLEITVYGLQHLKNVSKTEVEETDNISDVDTRTLVRNNMEHFLQRRNGPKHCGNFEASTASTNEKAERDFFKSKETGISTSATEEIPFRTAREMLITKSCMKQNRGYSKPSLEEGNVNSSKEAGVPVYFNYGITRKMLGARRTVRSGFVLPVAKDGCLELSPSPPTNCSPPIKLSQDVIDERLINIDPKMVDLIKSEIMHKYKPMDWDDIAGLDYVKSIIKEAVVYPLLRPDIFTGLRRPPRGILLFGPPGTGKTLIGKCIASQSQSTFFSISASSLTSKWVGESEKMVRALFAVAAVHQPSVVFIDEVDSLLSKRSESEHDSSRKLKNEFLVQLDGASTSEEDRVLVVGATNRPQELDDAARRRFARRLYIPLPEIKARIQILKNLLGTVSNDLDESNIEEIGHQTSGYSGADMDILCREASMEPLRAIPADQIPHITKDKVRPVNVDDFKSAVHSVRPSVSKVDLAQYIQWNREYGALQQLK